MRIVVDKLPEEPVDCVFSKLSNVAKTHLNRAIYVCTLRPNYTNKPKNVSCVCKGGEYCDLLVEHDKIGE